MLWSVPPETFELRLRNQTPNRTYVRLARRRHFDATLRELVGT